MGIVLFCLGYPEQALALSSAAIAEARRLAHPPTLATCLNIGATVLSLVGRRRSPGRAGRRVGRDTTEQGFAYWRALGTIYRGWVRVKNGDVTEGMSLLRSGSAAYRATGAEVWMPHYIALLASAYEIAGQVEEALTLLDDGLQIVERTGERWFAAELNRHKGQLLLRQGHSEAAEELYRKALSIAEEQEAKLWELRAAVSLARLRRDQSRHAEAPRPSRAGLRLVHRRLRHARSERREGAARRTGVSRRLACAESPPRMSAAWPTRLSTSVGREWLLRVDSRRWRTAAIDC